jgi:hypothetical protein
VARVFKIGVYDNEDKFLSSIRSLQENNIEIFEVFTPYPIHEVFDMLKRKTRLPVAAYFFGLFGMAATIGFLYFSSVINWPIVYGGKPFNSFPSFVVVTVVITIFLITILSLGLFSARSNLLPGRDNTLFEQGATDNKFVIVVETGTKQPDPGSMMRQNGAIEIFEKQFVKVKE